MFRLRTRACFPVRRCRNCGRRYCGSWESIAIPSECSAVRVVSLDCWRLWIQLINATPMSSHSQGDRHPQHPNSITRLPAGNTMLSERSNRRISARRWHSRVATNVSELLPGWTGKAYPALQSLVLCSPLPAGAAKAPAYVLVTNSLTDAHPTRQR